MAPLVVLLAFEEEAAIGRVVAETRAALPEAEILVVDDGSSDQTATAARDAGATVARHPWNLGVAAAEATGLRYAQRHGHRAVVRMDGDGQHDPQSGRALLAAIERGAELAVGSRFFGPAEPPAADGAASLAPGFRSTAARRSGNALLARIVSSLCGQRLTDPTSGLRAFGGRAIPFFAARFPHDYPEPESLVWASREGFRLEELPVRMRPRLAGQSSLTPLRSSYYMLKVTFALALELARTRP
ncbi:MAG: glycosyltransferase family 2 protein [Deltaproteobacteria bacterium]